MKTKFTKSETPREAQPAAKLDMNFNPLSADDSICCGPLRDPLPPTVLNVPAGTYEVEGSRYPLLRLVVEVVKHRTWHWVRGEGFRD